MLFLKCRRLIPLILSFALLLAAAVPDGSGKANAAQAGVGRGIVKLAAGAYHSLALKADGTVAAWGRNGEGQTDVPDGLSGVTAIAAGAYHSLALKADGTVVAWGYNSEGQADVPDGLSGVTAIAAGYQHSLALKSDGTVVAWGYNGQGQTNVPDELTEPGTVMDIAAGDIYSVALKSDGTVVAWAVSTPVLTELTVPGAVTDIAAKAVNSLALRADGTVVGWGDNSRGQAEVPTTLSGVAAIAAGAYHSLALKSDGAVVAWGVAPGDINYYGQTDVPADLDGVVAIAAGSFHSLALKADGTIVAWGRNSEGQTEVPDGLAKPVKGIDVAAGEVHSLALKADGTVVAWGNNAFGQTNVPAGLGGVAAIAAGEYHSLALKSDGTVVAWGDDSRGQIDVPGDLSDVTAIASGWDYSLALKADGTVAAWGRNGEGQTDVPDGLTGVVAIAAGGQFSLALRADGTVVAWGDDSYGQTDVPDGLTGVVAISAGGFHSLALKSDGTIVAWGDSGDLTNVPAGLTGVVAISAGYTHSLALKADGTVVAWGLNGEGQTNVPDGLGGVVAISAEGAHSLALKVDGTVVAWGYNYYGQTVVPGNDRLSGLTVQDVDMNPASSPSETTYTYYIGPSVSSVNITATLADATNAELYVDDRLQASGSAVSVSVSGASAAIPIRVEPYLKPPRTYSLNVLRDDTPPDVQFDPNGKATPSHTAEVTVTVTDEESGVDADSLQYAWAPSTAVPASGWTDFASGDTLEKTSGDGNWYLYIRARDLAGNVTDAADAVSDVFVLDNTAPELVLNGSNPMNIPQGGTYTEPGAVATDAIDGAIPASSITISGAVDMTRLGNYPVQYAVADRAGNTATVTRSVYVYDGDEPAIYLNGPNPMTVEANSPFVDPGATAHDVQDGDLSASIVVSGTVDTSTLGDYTLSYNVSDTAGNEAATVTRTVRVKDTQPPVLTLLGDPVTSVPVGGTFDDPGAQAIDAYYGDVSGRIVVTGTVDTSTAGEYTLRYNVTDPSGNAGAEATRTVKVTAPDVPDVPDDPDGADDPDGPDDSGNTGNSGKNGSSGSGGVAVIPQVSVKINDVVKRVGASYEMSGGQRITRIYPTAEQLSEAFAAEPGGIRIEAQDIGDSVKMDLPAAPLLHALELRPDALLEWSVNGNGLRMPLNVLQGVAEEATVTFGIAGAAGSVSGDWEGAIARIGGESLLPHPVVYSLQASDGARIDWGGTSAMLTAALPEAADPDQATAVRIDDNGRIRFAPAVFSNGGSPLVTIRSPYAGAYAVIRSAHSFADVNGHWAQADIVLMANKLVVEGRSQDRFVPDENISRVEFAAMLVRALGLNDEPDGPMPFRDVTTGAWYAGVVRAAHRDRLIDGFEDGTFRPADPITREQMAVMIVRAMEHAGYAPDASGMAAAAFADDADIAPWAYAAVNRLSGASIIRGLTVTKFGPREYASRAQSAALLKRMLQAMQFINS